MKYIILTYKDNIAAAEETKRILDETYPLPKHETIIVVGYKIGGDYTKYNVICHGIKDKIIDNYNDNIYYMEDDVRFTTNPMNIQEIPYYDIVWSVYRTGKLTNKPPHNVITGTQAVYFSKKAVFRLREYMKHNRFKQIDGYISEFIRKNPDLYFKQADPKIGYEQEHDSLISKKKDCKRYTKPN